MIRKEEALEYHAAGRPGKLQISVTKPCATQRDLALAYTPGVAEPCREIRRDPDAAYRYTARGNLVAVVSNGTAVLGLGNIGPLAGKPVMEGKAVLFKRFADIDVYDIEVAETDPEAFVRIVAALEPTFGGINLEDVKAPECFAIEEELQRRVKIPVFHDDQHGTAIISAAALMNALEIAGKAMGGVRVVVCGAGAAGIACANLYVALGVRPEAITLVDTKGVVYKGRAEGMNLYKERYAQDTPARTLAEALAGADVFLGVSGPGLVTPEMLRSMAPRPVVFAMANPDPEIPYPEAKKARPDAIVATGRSDFPNQVNNVLGFPFIFRGALDVRATCVNEAMKIAAARALARLAKEDVPDSVIRAYGGARLRFGPDYVIPKPFDPRVLLWVAPAVAEAAMETGVARVRLGDREAYRDALEARLGRSREIVRVLVHKAQRSPKRIVFPEGEEPKVLRAAQVILEEGVARPVLVGEEAAIRERAANLGLDLEGAEIVEPGRWPKLSFYVAQLHALRRRKGLTAAQAARAAREPQVFGMLMVRLGDADGLVSGVAHPFPEVLRSALEIVRPRRGASTVAGVCHLAFETGSYFLADAAVNVDPSAEEIAEIALLAAETARGFDVEPRVALISFSNFGSARHPAAEKMARAVEILRGRAPSLRADGEMQADVAVTPELLNGLYPFNALKGAANVLVFPDLDSANASSKLLARLGGASLFGPILAGMSRPVHILQEGCDANDVVCVTAVAVEEAQRLEGAAGSERAS
mgnify:CR=1 FL=1